MSTCHAYPRQPSLLHLRVFVVKVMLVSGSRVTRRLLGRALRQSGLDIDGVVECEGAREAIAQASVVRPDLVVSDWQLSGKLTGLWFLSALRSQHVPARFGFVTADGSTMLRATAEAAGADFVLSKPFTTEEVAEALRARRTVDVPSHTGSSSSVKPRARAERLLPSRQVIREGVEVLLARKVQAGDGERVTLDLDTGPLHVGTVVEDSGRLVGLVAVDLPLAVYAGASLGLLPSCTAREAVDAREVTGLVRENLHEVITVVAGLLNVDGAPHVRLGEVFEDSEDMPPPVLVTLKSLWCRDDLRLTIHDYGAGNLSLVLVNDR